jgi:hypothetical protein
VKLVASIRSLSSRGLAVCCAAAYVLVSAVLGALLLVRPDVPSVADPGLTPPTYISDDGARSTSTTPRPPRGFQRVSGPEGIQTVIPVGWRIARAGAPGAMRAADPEDAGRVLGYGGAPSESKDIAALHLEAETRFADRAADYERIALNQAVYGGHPAIEWEYEHNDGSGRQHVHALYWLVDGVEYFVYASAPADAWSRTKPVYDAMVASSRP